MEFEQSLNFYEHKIENLWKFECFLDVSNNTLLHKTIEHQRFKLIMKMKGHFMKIVLLNEIVKHLL
jgi:hypothetical protein